MITKISIGSISLNVSNKDLLMRFYVKCIGFNIIEESRDRVKLGMGNTEFLEFTIDPTLPASKPGSAGLYHLAILFESRTTLVEALARLFNNYPGRYQGSADHLVSEAFYFSDLEGNGVELYYDKDPTTWVWENGRVKMDTLYIDVNNYIAQYQGIKDEKVKIGHIHLKIGSIEAARIFYVDTLGFSITAELSSALFLSDGIYHHYVGLNIWESLGAGPRTPSIGLGEARFYMSQEDIIGLRNRLESRGVEFEESDGGVTVKDPWNNRLIFCVNNF